MASIGKSTKRRSVIATIALAIAIVAAGQILFGGYFLAAAPSTPELARNELIEVLKRGDIKRLSEITTEKGMTTLAMRRPAKQFLLWHFGAKPTAQEMLQWSRDIAACSTDVTVFPNSANTASVWGRDGKGFEAACGFVRSTHGWLLDDAEHYETPDM